MSETVTAAEPLVRPQELAASVERAWQSWLLRGRRQPTAHPTVWASGWRPCARRMALDMTVPDQQLPFTAELLGKFRRGDDRERDLLADANRIGRDADPPFDVINQQERFELKDRKGRVAITGKVDARIRFSSRDRGAPMEVKAWAPNLVNRIDTFDDLFESPYTRGGGYQLLSYLYGANEPLGFLLLDRSGLPKLLPVELDATNLDRMEAFLTRAEAVIDHVQAGTLPDFHDDASECRRCPFYATACDPPLTAKPVRVLTDPELELALERWWTLREAGKEWCALDADIKRELRGVENAQAGHFVVQGRWSKYSRLDLPPEVKRQYTVSDPKGRFSLEIDRL
jgi:hypothetical protein